VRVPVLLCVNKLGSAILILYAHGNGTDIGCIEPEMMVVSRELGTHLMAVEYPGYGKCRGKATMESVDAAVTEVLKFIVGEIKWPVENVVLWGCSIGCAPLIKAAKQ